MKLILALIFLSLVACNPAEKEELADKKNPAIKAQDEILTNVFGGLGRIELAAKLNKKIITSSDQKVINLSNALNMFGCNIAINTGNNSDDMRNDNLDIGGSTCLLNASIKLTTNISGSSGTLIYTGDGSFSFSNATLAKENEISQMNYGYRGNMVSQTGSGQIIKRTVGQTTINAVSLTHGNIKVVLDTNTQLNIVTGGAKSLIGYRKVTVALGANTISLTADYSKTSEKDNSTYRLNATKISSELFESYLELLGAIKDAG